MKYSARGFIFLWTLCLVSLISLLLLTSMQHVLLYYQAINRQEKRHQQAYQMEHLAQALLAAKHQRQECMRLGAELKQIINLLKAHKGCTIKVGEDSYNYLIEDLGLFPCLLVKQGDSLDPSRHFRVSLLAQNSSLLQVRIIKPATGLSCDSVSRQVRTGISSWLYRESS